LKTRKFSEARLFINLKVFEKCPKTKHSLNFSGERKVKFFCVNDFAGGGLNKRLSIWSDIFSHSEKQILAINQYEWD
jgi:hypothetical protein